MNTRLTLGGLGLAAILASTPAFAHHPGGSTNAGTAGPIVTISASTLAAGQSAAAVMFEATKFDPFSDAQLLEFAAAHEHVHSLDSIYAPSIGYAYGITNDLTVSLKLPYVLRTNNREGHHSHGPEGNTVEKRGDAEGVGDLTILGQYRFFNDRASATEFAALFGVKAPTGRTDAKDNEGVRFETELQPGTGSWDFLLGAAATKRFGAWSFDANVLYVIATEGAQNTNLGDRFQFNAGVSYRLAGLGVYTQRPMYHGGISHDHDHHHESSGPALDLVLEINGEWHDKQKVRGGDEDHSGIDPNSGGTVVYLSPGVRLSKDTWSAFVSVGIPIVNDLNGFQDDTELRLLSGVSFTF